MAHTDAAQSTYDKIIALLPQLTIHDLARLELEIRRTIQRDPNGDMARKSAAVDSIPHFGLTKSDEAGD